MAGDWIKMRTDLYRHPKVCMIADALLRNGDASRDATVTSHHRHAASHPVTGSSQRDVMRHAVVGSLVTVWGVSRHAGKRVGDDLVLHGISAPTIDDMAHFPGLASALQSVGWLVVESECLVFPRFFEELNVEPGASSRSTSAERMRRMREKNRAKADAATGDSCDVTVTSRDASHVTSRDASRDAREEKRREENKDTPKAPADAGGVGGVKKSKPSPPEADPLFARFWSAYPRKVAKSAAAKAFAKLRADEPILLRLLDAIRRAAQSEQWVKDGGQFIPHPASWLNGRRWEDEVQTGVLPFRAPPDANQQRLKLLGDMLRNGAITQDEYDERTQGADDAKHAF